jgi:hypothetical protein
MTPATRLRASRGVGATRQRGTIEPPVATPRALLRERFLQDAVSSAAVARFAAQLEDLAEPHVRLALTSASSSTKGMPRLSASACRRSFWRRSPTSAIFSGSPGPSLNSTERERQHFAHVGEPLDADVPFAGLELHESAGDTPGARARPA